MTPRTAVAGTVRPRDDLLEFEVRGNTKVEGAAQGASGWSIPPPSTRCRGASRISTQGMKWASQVGTGRGPTNTRNRRDPRAFDRPVAENPAARSGRGIRDATASLSSRLSDSARNSITLRVFAHRGKPNGRRPSRRGAEVEAGCDSVGGVVCSACRDSTAGRVFAPTLQLVGDWEVLPGWRVTISLCTVDEFCRRRAGTGICRDTIARRGGDRFAA